ncbi:MAG: hypothetical protein F6K34_01400 [Okeania sp. SIO4D6]|uniref:hypothetical protein n=1 Tax=unclassified Okeania TaxID=2634635 RepID=UPI0013BBF84F|nr:MULTISPECIES: hypothetical protein [unclassified Okeania]NEP03584.1 hypothetical protein [Okeania sp. SIO4D6]NEP76072.1 hypothetical protein [Okeania sp. SIO2G5]NEP97221.1 hypothetical protein [Okeania sp. SIO2F5]
MIDKLKALVVTQSELIEELLLELKECEIALSPLRKTTPKTWHKLSDFMDYYRIPDFETMESEFAANNELSQMARDHHIELPTDLPFYPTFLLKKYFNKR